MTSVLLEATGLAKSYTSGEGKLQVLQGVDLALPEGQMLGIVGSSGAGKSTLMHLLGTLDFPDEGRLFLDGRDVFALSEPERTRLRNRTIGFIFQFHHLLPEFTALENVAMPLFIARTDKDEALERAHQLMSALGIGARSEHRPAQLSGGEQQRVAVARALVSEPRLVLADEPTGNLDSRHSQDLVELLMELHRRRGLTSVVVTHSEAVASACDRVLYMEDGKLTSARARPL